MNTKDSTDLLKECDAGVKMGIRALEDCIDYVENEKFKEKLVRSRKDHQKLQSEIETLLRKCDEPQKDPAAMARGMSYMKTNMKMMMHHSDSTIADLVTDGCNMGVKTLHKYLNQYENAGEQAKDIAKNLANLEERLTLDIRHYL